MWSTSHARFALPIGVALLAWPHALGSGPDGTVSLSGRETIGRALRVVADASSLNIVFGRSISKELQDMPAPSIGPIAWNQALDFLMESTGLCAEISGNVMHILGPVGECPHAGLRTSEDEFTGKPISLDFKDGKLGDCVHYIADVAGLTLQIEGEPPGLHRPYFKLTEVPWDQALDLILRNACATGFMEGNTLRVVDAGG